MEKNEVVEVVEVVGEQRLNFKTEDGEQIDGYNIYYVMTDLDAKNLIGRLAIKKFMSKEVYDRLTTQIGKLELVGYKGDFNYNDKGKINGIR